MVRFYLMYTAIGAARSHQLCTTAVAMYCRHDDQSMYTGVYAHGGPTNVDWKPSFKDVVNRDVCQTRANKRGLISWTA